MLWSSSVTNLVFLSFPLPFEEKPINSTMKWYSVVIVGEKCVAVIFGLFFLMGVYLFALLLFVRFLWNLKTPNMCIFGPRFWWGFLGKRELANLDSNGLMYSGNILFLFFFCLFLSLCQSDLEDCYMQQKGFCCLENARTHTWYTSLYKTRWSLDVAFSFFSLSHLDFLWMVILENHFQH